MCDIRYAARSALFMESYIKVGLIPGDGGAYLLPRLVGLPKALELLWTGDPVDATEAESLGIVSKVCDDDRLLQEAHQFAARLANGPRVAIQLTKQVVYQALGGDLLTVLDAITGPMGVAFNTADHREAVSAFADRRTPHFRGR